MKCEGCHTEFKTRTIEVAGTKVELRYCDACLEKVKASYDKLTKDTQFKRKPPKKGDT